MAAQLARVQDGVLRHPDRPHHEAIHVGTAAWWRWLDAETTRSFAFHGATGHFTARKAGRRRGGMYWTAYRKVHARVVSVYVGKSAALTADRLNAVAAQLTERTLGGENGGLDGAHRRAAPRVGDGAVVLATKLYRPRPRATLLPRTHVLEHLAAAGDRGITLLSAPAGFGKSTLLSLWLAESACPVAWLTLDPADNDLNRWLRYLIATLQTVAPSIGATIMPLLDSVQPPTTFLLTTVLNDLVALDRPVRLVLDDYHTITTPVVHDAVTMVLDHRPPQLHVVIASREDPPLPLSRWRAAAELTELRAADLRFTTAEVTAFFTTAVGVALTPTELTALERRTEGWVAGLQLVALAMEAHPEHGALIAALSRPHRFIVEYLSDEVLRRLPHHLQTFLLQTSILDRLCAPLCDAVVLDEAASAQAAYSQLVLDEIERKNLFLIPLDGHGHWFRFHQLFRDVLRQRLVDGVRPQELAQLHRRASVWYAEHDTPSEAAAHALAAQDWALMGDLIERYGIRLASRGQAQMVRAWLNALPKPTAPERPLLAVIDAGNLLLTNQPAAAEQRLREAEASQRANPADVPDARIDGYIAMVRATLLRSMGDLDGAVAQARRARTLLPTSDVFATTASVAATHIFWEHGDATPAAEQQVRDAVGRAHAAADLISVVYGTVGLARLRVLQGRLTAAVHTYRQVLELIPEAVLDHLFGGVSYFVGLGEVLCEQNDLHAAEPLLVRGIELSRGEILIYPTVLIQGYGALARLRQARGDDAGATRLLAELMERARHRRLVPAMLARIAAAQAELALTQGDQTAALRWASETGLTPADVGQYPREAEQLTLARIWIAQGRDDHAGPYLRDALSLLAQLRAAAERQGRTDSLHTINILRALALAAQHDTVASRDALECTLAAGAPEGYVRRFLDEGPPLAALLHYIPASTAVPGYVARLLAAFGGASGKPASATSPDPRHGGAAAPVEALTGREREVLHLLAAGCGTRAIAQQRIVSEGTVKRHVSNILGKLAVHSRLEAVARAHALGLLT